MNKSIKIAVLNLIFFQLNAQNLPLLDSTKRWILVNNKIEKNEIYLASYHKSKVRANTLVLSFAQNGKIAYDYETNSRYESNTNIHYLDINSDQSSWAFDTLTKSLVLSIQAGYITVDDFKFQREYKIDEVHDGYILMKSKETFYEDLRKKNQPVTQHRKVIPAVVKTTPAKAVIADTKTESIQKTQTDSTLITQNIISEVLKPDSLQIHTASIETKTIQPVVSAPAPVVVAQPIKINYYEQNKALLDKTKRWILVRNKIERGDIYLTPYHESKLTINNLVMSLADDGKLEYDYESDPKVRFCAGVDFLDIDTDETTWIFDGDTNILTLTLKGGYASLDDFKFKRDYSVEVFDDGFALRRVKEHYFNDFRKPVKATGNYKKRRK